MRSIVWFLKLFILWLVTFLIRNLLSKVKISKVCFLFLICLKISTNENYLRQFKNSNASIARTIGLINLLIFESIFYSYKNLPN